MIEAADALGRPGDPRLKLWVAIPAGRFLMGAQKRDARKPGYDRDAGGDSESPVREVALDAYRIGRYPVTVGKYRRFVEDRGYEETSRQRRSMRLCWGEYGGRKCSTTRPWNSSTKVVTVQASAK